jgi:glycosyltransferase involved in cell wall biosynthesis
MIKKVLFITSLYHPHIGGVETFVDELSSNLSKKGISSNILTKRWPDSLLKMENFKETKIFRVDSFKSPQEFEKVLEELSKIEAEIKPDIIHIVGMRRSLPILGLYLSRKWNVPLVTSYGGGEIVDSKSVDEVAKKTWIESQSIAKVVTENCDWNVTFSKDLVKIIKENFKDIVDVDVIHAGINLGEISLAKPKDYLKNRKILFSLRRLVWSKGVDLSIECFSRVSKDFPSFDLIIAGDGDQKDKLISRVKELHLEDRIFFIGNISLDESYSWLKRSYLTMVPSRSEGGGIVNIVAQACGCPIVGSNATGIAEYTIENKTSLLFNVGYISEYEIQLRRFLTDEKLREEMSKASLEYSKEFSWDQIVNIYQDNYNKVKDRYVKKELIIRGDFEYKNYLK